MRSLRAVYRSPSSCGAAVRPRPGGGDTGHAPPPCGDIRSILAPGLPIAAADPSRGPAEDDPTFEPRGRIKGLTTSYAPECDPSPPGARERASADRAARPPSRPRTARPHALITSTAARPASRTRRGLLGVHQAHPLGLRRTRPRPASANCGPDERRCRGSGPRSRCRRDHRARGSSRFTYQFLKRQPRSQNSHTDQGSPGRASLSTPLPEPPASAPWCAARCSGWPAVPGVRAGRRRAPGVRTAVPGAIHTASRSSVSWTTVTGRQMWNVPLVAGAWSR